MANKPTFCMMCLHPVESTESDDKRNCICEECYEITPYPDVIVSKRLVQPKPTDEIRDMEIEILGFMTTRDETSKLAALVKQRNIEVVETEWTSTKNPDLSNQTKRNIAIDALLASDRVYKEYTDIVADTTKEIQLLNIDLRFEIREFQRDIVEIPIHRIQRIEEDIQMNPLHSHYDEE